MKPLTKLITVSPKGLDFDNQELNEDTLNAGILVVYRRRLFVTRNRHGRVVELVTLGNHKLFTTAKCSNVRLAKNKLK